MRLAYADDVNLNGENHNKGICQIFDYFYIHITLSTLFTIYQVFFRIIQVPQIGSRPV